MRLTKKVFQTNVEERWREPIWTRLRRVIRRTLLLRYNRRYVDESLAKRKGKCLLCGCCGVVDVKCEYFNPETKLCILWKEKGKEALPLHCRTYPFDEKDKVLYSKLNCGFYWK